VGSVRDESSPEVAELKSAKTGPGSKLLIVHIESTSFTDVVEASETIKNLGINYVDIIIPTAGGSPNVQPLQTVDPKEMISNFQVNALAPLMLFQSFRPLLQNSKKGPKWVSMSTGAGSIGSMETVHSWVGPAYGTSKAALNWITK
jgi:NAD(P)-dependent dehydrogenase (short-subunit alcohol dehydrogenase family)